MCIVRKKNFKYFLILFSLIIFFNSTVTESNAANVFDTTGFGSSDPAGLTFVPTTGALLLVDSEVEETPFFTGFNMFEVTLSGSLLASYSTIGFTTEPTGVTYHTVTGMLYISDDDQNMVFEVNPLSPEVLLSSFPVDNFGVNDAEGITNDPTTGNLYIVDGNRSIYEFTTSGNLVSTISLPVEIRDPEGVYFDGDSGHFFVVSGPDEDKIFEVTTSGVIANVINITSFGVSRPKGITFAPSSDDPNFLSVFIADYGSDEVNDGRIFEISLADDVTNPKVQMIIDAIKGFDSSVFKKPKDQEKLEKDLNKVVKEIEKGKFKNALKKLNKVLEKTDGCALRGAPDTKGKKNKNKNKEDKIQDCNAQAQIYPLVLEAIAYLSLLH